MKIAHLVLLIGLGALNSECALNNPKNNHFITYDEFKKIKYHEFYHDKNLIESFQTVQWRLSDEFTEKIGIELATRLTTEYDTFHPRAHKLLASYFLEKNDYDSACKHLRILAENDDPDSQRILGKILLATQDENVKKTAIELLHRAALPREVQTINGRKYYVDWKAQLACGEFWSIKEKKDLFLHIMNHGRPFLGESWVEQLYRSSLYQQFVRMNNDKQLIDLKNEVEYEAFQRFLHDDLDAIMPFLESSENRTHEMNKELGFIYQKNNNNKQLLQLAEYLIGSNNFQDKTLAVHYLEELANFQMVEAQKKLIGTYLGFAGYTPDFYRALNYLQRLGQSSFTYFCENDLHDQFEKLIDPKDQKAQFIYGQYLIENSWFEEENSVKWLQKGIEYIKKSEVPQAHWYLAERAFLVNNLTSANEYLRLAGCQPVNAEIKSFAKTAIESAQACAISDGETAFTLSQLYKVGVEGLIDKNESKAQQYQQLAVKLEHPEAIVQELKKSQHLTVNECLKILEHTCNSEDSETRKMRKNAWTKLQEDAVTDKNACAALVIGLLQFHGEGDESTNSGRFLQACEQFEKLSNSINHEYEGNVLYNEAYNALRALAGTFPKQVLPLLSHYRIQLAKHKPQYDQSYYDNIEGLRIEINHMNCYDISCPEIEKQMREILIRDAKYYYSKGDENSTAQCAQLALNLFPTCEEALFWSDLAIVAQQPTLQGREIIANSLISLALDDSDENGSEKLFYVAKKLAQLGLFIDKAKDLNEELRHKIKRLLLHEMQFNPIENLLLLVTGKENGLWTEMTDINLDVRSIKNVQERTFATQLLNYLKITNHSETSILQSDIKNCIEFYPFMAAHSLKIKNNNEAISYCNQFMEAYKAGTLNVNNFIQNELLEQAIVCLAKISENPQAFDLYLDGCELLMVRLDDPLELIRFAEIINDCFNESEVNSLIFKNHFCELRTLFEKHTARHPAFHTILGDFIRTEQKIDGNQLLNHTKIEQRTSLAKAVWHYHQALQIVTQFHYSECFSEKNIKKKLGKTYEQLALTYDDGKNVCKELKEYFEMAIKENPNTGIPLLYIAQLYDKHKKEHLIDEIINLIEMQARCGNVKFQELVGSAYLHGSSVKIPLNNENKTLELTFGKNKNKGLEFLQLASKNGCYRASRLLADDLLRSPKKSDQRKGLELLIAAFNQGGTDFAVDIAGLYLEQKNIAKASEWLSKPIIDNGRNAIKHFFLAKIGLEKKLPDQFIKHLMCICVDELSVEDRIRVTKKMEENFFVLVLHQYCNFKDRNIVGLASYLFQKIRYHNSFVINDEKQKKVIHDEFMKELIKLEKHDLPLVSCAAGIDLVRENLENPLSNNRNEMIRVLLSLSTVSKKILKLDSRDEVVEIMRAQIVKLLERFTQHKGRQELFTGDEFKNYIKNLFSEFLEDEYNKVQKLEEYKTVKTFINDVKKLNKSKDDNNNNHG